MRLSHVARSAALLALAPFAAPLAAAQGQLNAVDGTSAIPNLGATLVRFHDLNGDGWRDFLAGAPHVDPQSDGHVMIVSGRFLAAGTPPAVLGGVKGQTQEFGAAVIGLDDFDGDGDKDFAVGAPDEFNGTGFGFPDGMVRIYDELGVPLGEIKGLVNYERLGHALALVGDINGDGFKDILVGAPGFSGGIPSVTARGKAAIVSGKSLLQSSYVVLRVHMGELPLEKFGSTLATGFFNGDAVIDYAIGTPYRESSSGVPDSGLVRIYDGATGALIRTLHGAGGSHFGASLSGGLNVTDDGVHDLVIGAPHANTNGSESGSVFVYSGAGLVGGGILLPAYTWHGPAAGAHFGAAVALVQDLNGDGRADALAGAPDYEPFLLGQDNGMFRCYSGQTGELLGHRTGQANEHLGGSFVSADTWDGKPGWEFVVGSPESDLAGADFGRVASYSIFPNSPTTYCTAKVNSLGCTPAISSVGVPSVFPGTHFNVKAANVLNNVPGILIYALDAGATPFQGAFLCVGSPVTRTAGKFSGGAPPPTADCSGSFLFDFNFYIQGGADPTLVAGQEVFCQFWSRDVASPGGSNLTGGIRFLIHP